MIGKKGCVFLGGGKWKRVDISVKKLGCLWGEEDEKCNRCGEGYYTIHISPTGLDILH